MKSFRAIQIQPIQKIRHSSATLLLRRSINFRCADVFRSDRSKWRIAGAGRDPEHPTLKSVRWDLNESTTWVLTGPAGSGKSTLIESLAGKHKIIESAGVTSIIDTVDSLDQIGNRTKVELVTFAPNHSSYYARFNGLDPDDDMTLLDYLDNGLPNVGLESAGSVSASDTCTPSLTSSAGSLTDQYATPKATPSWCAETIPAAPQQQLAKEDDLQGDRFWDNDAALHSLPCSIDPRIAHIADELEISGLLRQSLITLSNGQMRRARIARALLSQPHLLCLDEPFAGLDDNTARTVSTFLQNVLHNSCKDNKDAALRIVMALRSQDYLTSAQQGLLSWVTHALLLDGKGGVAAVGPRAEIDPVLARQAGCESQPSARSLEDRVRAAKAAGTRSKAAAANKNAGAEGKPLVILRDVSITYSGKPVISGVDWSILCGERWGLVGPSGSGKTSLLAMMMGDHLQAYSNDVTLFGTRRGDGDSIWDIRQRVGYSGPELHSGAFTSPGLTVAQVIATGFGHGTASADGVEPSLEQLSAINTVVRQIAAFIAPGITYSLVTPAYGAEAGTIHDNPALPWLDHPFRTQAAGLQRLALFVRAVVKLPDLLALDEPFQAMDPNLVEACKAWLDAHLQPCQALVVVTHHAASELPSCTNRLLRMGADGRPADMI